MRESSGLATGAKGDLGLVWEEAAVKTGLGSGEDGDAEFTDCVDLAVLGSNDRGKWKTRGSFFSSQKGCCWAGRSSGSWGSAGGGEDPNSESRAWSLRDGLWKQKQNMSLDDEKQ